MFAKQPPARMGITCNGNVQALPAPPASARSLAWHCREQAPPEAPPGTFESSGKLCCDSIPASNPECAAAGICSTHDSSANCQGGLVHHCAACLQFCLAHLCIRHTVCQVMSALVMSGALILLSSARALPHCVQLLLGYEQARFHFEGKPTCRPNCHACMVVAAQRERGKPQDSGLCSRIGDLHC